MNLLTDSSLLTCLPRELGCGQAQPAGKEKHVALTPVSGKYFTSLSSVLECVFARCVEGGLSLDPHSDPVANKSVDRSPEL